MNLDLKKTAIVTGGSSGIGKAIAIELLKSGLAVHICGRKIKSLEDACLEMAQFGEIHYFQLDISSREEINRFINTWNNDLHVLVNNAGICGIERLEDRLNLWEDIINTNLNGLHYLTKGLVKHIQPGGSIINISSQLGVEGRIGFGAYCASKHAVLGLTKCWAKELGVKNITVNAICPGWVKTEMAMADVEKMGSELGLAADEMYKKLCQELDMKRFIEPQEVAELVCFMVSPQGRGITGQSYFIK